MCTGFAASVNTLRGLLARRGNGSSKQLSIDNAAKLSLNFKNVFGLVRFSSRALPVGIQIGYGF
jgi:hypothetical protein